MLVCARSLATRWWEGRGSKIVKILFVHERLGAHGGAEANVLATAGALRGRGHEVGLIHGPGTGRAETAWEQVFAGRFPHDGSRTAEEVCADVDATFRPDVVFLHKTNDTGLLEALATGSAPVVRMIHDHELACMRGYRYNPITRCICTRPVSTRCLFPCGASVARRNGPGFPLKWVGYVEKLRELAVNRRFAAFIVASGYMRDDLTKNDFPASRLEVLPPVPPENEEEFQSSFDGRNRIVFSGQLVRGKGVDVLLDSLALLRTPFEAVIAGDGGHRAYCERRCRRLGLGDRVRFTGFLPQENIREHYRDASVAVVSSVWPEPFGMVGLEAMRCGLPVVGFDVGGIKEWLQDGETGYLVPWMDRSGFARRLDSLLRDKLLARTLGENGREQAAARFGFASYLCNLESLLDRVASARLCATAR